MLYEIINPSDPYTLEADDPKSAALACLLLGEGGYGLIPIDSEEPEVPIMLLWSEKDIAAWWEKTFGPGETWQEYLAANREKVADVLDSVLVGSVADRKTYFHAMTLIESEEGRRAFREKYLDDRRTSLNNIGARAWKLAEALRKAARRGEGGGE